MKSTKRTIRLEATIKCADDTCGSCEYCYREHQMPKCGLFQVLMFAKGRGAKRLPICKAAEVAGGRKGEGK